MTLLYGVTKEGRTIGPDFSQLRKKRLRLSSSSQSLTSPGSAPNSASSAIDSYLLDSTPLEENLLDFRVEDKRAPSIQLSNSLPDESGGKSAEEDENDEAYSKEYYDDGGEYPHNEVQSPEEDSHHGSLHSGFSLINHTPCLIFCFFTSFSTIYGG